MTQQVINLDFTAEMHHQMKATYQHGPKLVLKTQVSYMKKSPILGTTQPELS